MFSYSFLSPGNFLTIQKSARLPVLYRLVLFCLVVLFLSVLMSTRSFAVEGRGIKVINEAPPLTGKNYVLVKCNSTKFTVSYDSSNSVFELCNRVFIVPVVNGKQLTKYAHTYNPAAYCVDHYLTNTYTVNMKPKPYTIHLGCQV